MNKIVTWIIVLIVIVAGFFVLSKKSEPTFSGPIKIGVMIPLTGDAAVYGEPTRNIYQMALDDINKSGGIKGNKLELIIEDSKCDGKNGASVAQKLVNIDKVQVILGGICSSETLAAIPIATTAKVLVISPTATSPDLTGISKFFFRTHPSDATQGKVLAELAYNNKGWKNVGFITEQTDFAQGVYKSFKDVFEKLGGKISTNEEFPIGASDLRSQLTKLMTSKPDALFIAAQTTTSGEKILKQMKDLGWKPNLMIIDTLSSDPKFVQDHKSILEGAYAAEFGVDLTNSKMKNLVDIYKQNYNSELPYQTYMQDVYDSIYLLRDGIVAVGYNGEKLAEWSRTVKDWQGASGKLSIDQNGDRVGGHEPRIVKDGELLPLTP